MVLNINELSRPKMILALSKNTFCEPVSAKIGFKVWPLCGALVTSTAVVAPRRSCAHSSAAVCFNTAEKFWH
jgi:hypothetical protein